MYIRFNYSDGSDWDLPYYQGLNLGIHMPIPRKGDFVCLNNKSFEVEKIIQEYEVQASSNVLAISYLHVYLK
jgi:hypothetical protein